jgi:hypothetical protein
MKWETFAARLACRVAGHDWSTWHISSVRSQRRRIGSRYCQRHCGLVGSAETKVLPWDVTTVPGEVPPPL